MQQIQILNLIAILAGWGVFYVIAQVLDLESRGWEVHPLYALIRSKRLNNFIIWLAELNPGLWRIFGNVAVASSVGQVAFISYILGRNLWNFIFVPEQASPVQPLIPGVTISLSSLPWFLLAAGLIILLHELSHGIQCAVEGVPIKNSALLIAVITFGGAVEPDEEAIEEASLLSKMRIFASGSLINLLTGLMVIPLFIIFQNTMPQLLGLFLNWTYFISINLAMMNMLPIGPLDGGQMWREWTATIKNGEVLQKAANVGFMGLIGGNIVLSLAQFGLIPL
ncbi:MAG: site-2 protease family protein [Candidatus Bathyarchaeia archaeon]